MKKLGFVIMLGLILVLTGCTVTINGKEVSALSWNLGGASAEKSEVKETAIDTQNRIVVSNSRGEIRIIPWDKSSVQVNIFKKIRAAESQEKLERLLDELAVDITKTPGNVDIKVRYIDGIQGFTQQSVRLEVFMPERIATVIASTSSGNIALSDFKNLEEFQLTSTSGKLEVLNVAAREYSVMQTSGNMDIQNVTGSGTIKATSGNIRLKNINGDIEHKATSGNCDIENMEGKMVSEISSGNMQIRHAYLKSPSSFNMKSGRMEVEAVRIDQAGNYQFYASSGDIRLKLPEAAGFEVVASSHSGNIRNEFIPGGTQDRQNHHYQESKGIIGNGGPKVEIESSSGSISILKFR